MAKPWLAACLLAATLTAQATCDCETQSRQCEAPTLAAQFKALPAANPLLATPADAKVAFQRFRLASGDAAVAKALGMKLPAIGKAQFDNPEFVAKLAKTTFEKFGINFAEASPDLSFPGTDAGKLPLPKGKVVGMGHDAKGACWEELSHPFQLTAQGQQLKTAFGHDFPEVGRIVEGRTNAAGDDIELRNTCGFVMLSSRWAITALHCVAEQTAPGGTWRIKPFKGTAAGAWRGERAMFLGQPGPLTVFPGGCFGLGGKTSCPWEMVQVAEVKAYALESHQDEWRRRMPVHDIALVRLQAAPKLAMDYPLFADPGYSKGTVTLVAYGKVAPPYEEFFRLQVGWNLLGRSAEDGKTFAWNPSKSTNQSSVCPGDSGGAVYAGFENGGCNCGTTGSPKRRLKGLVSFVELPGSQQAQPASLAQCQNSSTAGAVVATHYKAWICAAAPEIAACKN